MVVLTFLTEFLYIHSKKKNDHTKKPIRNATFNFTYVMLLAYVCLFKINYICDILYRLHL